MMMNYNNNNNNNNSIGPFSSYSIHRNYDITQEDCISEETLLIPGQELSIESSAIETIKLYREEENSSPLLFDNVSNNNTTAATTTTATFNNLEGQDSTREIVKNVDHLFLLNHLLHPNECHRILHSIEDQKNEGMINEHKGKIESLKFESIQSEYPEEYRNSRRIIFNDKELAQNLWKRMKKYLVRHSFVRPYGMDNGGCWKPIGVNECMRLSKYEKGNYFKPHVDGQFVRNSDERSVYTLLIYLNEGFGGGETRFLKVYHQEGEIELDSNNGRVKQKTKLSRSDKKMAKKKFAKEAHKMSYLKDNVDQKLKENSTLQYKHLCSITPKMGSAAIFNHDLYHEGRPVTDGIKYILRTEIMFKRVDSNSAFKKKDDSKLYEQIMATLKQSDDLEKKGKVYESTEYYRKVQDLLISNGHSMSLLMIPKFRIKGNFTQSHNSDSFDNELTILPDESLIHIFSYLQDWEVCTLILPLDRFFHHIGRDYHLWQGMYMKRWGNDITNLLKQMFNKKNSELDQVNRLDNTTSIDETPHQNEQQDWYHIYVMKRYFEKEFEPVFLDVGFDRSNLSTINGEVMNVRSLMHRPRFSHYTASSFSSYRLTESDGNSRTKPFNLNEITSHFQIFILVLLRELKKTPQRHPIVFVLSSVLMKNKTLQEKIKERMFQCNVPAVCILPRCFLLSIHFSVPTCLVIDITQVCLSVHAIVENNKDLIESIYFDFPSVLQEAELDFSVLSEQGNYQKTSDKLSFDNCKLLTMIDQILGRYSNEIRFKLSENIFLSGEVMENKKQFLDFQKTIKTRFNNPHSRYKIKFATDGEEAVRGAKSFSKLPNFKDFFSYWFNPLE